MVFWFFMLFSDLLVPFMMLIFGKRFIKNAPAEINTLFGYRTAMSMKNRETWEFAHRHCGKVWFISGLLLLPVSILFLLPLIGKSEDCIGTAGLVICAVQLLVMLISIISTEAALKRNFDQNGIRR